MGFIENQRKKKKDLAKMKKEGRYEDIYRKYGKRAYAKILTHSMYNEIKTERGTISAVLWRTKKFGIDFLQNLGLAAFATTALIGSQIPHFNAKEYNEEAIKYEEEIKEYNNKINNYALDIKKKNYSDIQIIMKVIDDMWKSIKGYKQPEEEARAFTELNLAHEDGYGVCRNMASDVAKKLNAINPEYNARIMGVYLSNGKFELAEVKRNLLEDEETTETCNLLPNHMIVLADIDNIILAIDPTNPALGIYHNGKIIMFNAIDKENADKIMEAKEAVTALFSRFEESAITDVAADYAKSFNPLRKSMDELTKELGVDAQNEALRQVRVQDIVEQSFDEKYRVDLSDLNKFTVERRINNQNSKQGWEK